MLENGEEKKKKRKRRDEETRTKQREVDGLSTKEEEGERN